MRAWVWILLACLACAAAGAAAGADALYHATVPVADAGGAARDQAIVQAAGAVLVQLSGDPQVLSRPGVATALRSAPGLVKDYRYVPGGSGSLALDVGFDPQALLTLARQLDLPIWPAPRPPVLALVNVDGQPVTAAEAAPLLAAGAARGIRFVLPQAGAPAAAALAAGDAQAMAALARGYRTGLALIGTLAAGGGRWTLVTGTGQQSWQSPVTGTATALAAAGNAAADRLVARFAAAPEAAAAVPGRLWVGHLRTAQDYAGLMALLRRDPRIQGIQPVQASHDALLLLLTLDAPLATVTADLAASGHLVGAPARPDADMALDWVR